MYKTNVAFHDTIAARIEYDNPCLIPHRLGEYSLSFHRCI